MNGPDYKLEENLNNIQIFLIRFRGPVTVLSTLQKNSKTIFYKTTLIQNPYKIKKKTKETD